MNENRFNTLLFHFEWENDLLNSHPTAYFELLLESRGYSIEHNGQKMEACESIKEVKNKVKEHDKERMTRVLEEIAKEKKGIPEDDQLKDTLKRRMEILKIDSLEDSMQYIEYVSDDHKLQKHFNISLLFHEKGQLEEKLLSSNEMTIKKIGGSLNKALLMKDIEEILGISSFDIDSKKYEFKWKERIQLSDQTYQEYKVAFRVTTTQKPTTWGELYKQLVKMYRNMDNDILKVSRTKDKDRKNQWICQLNELAKGKHEALRKKRRGGLHESCFL